MQDFLSEYSDKVKYSEILYIKSVFVMPTVENFVKAFLYLKVFKNIYYENSLQQYFKMENEVTNESIKIFIVSFQKFVNNREIFSHDMQKCLNNFEDIIISNIEKNWSRIDQKSLFDFLLKLGINLEIPYEKEPCYTKQKIDEIKKHYKILKIFNKYSWVICILIWFILFYILKWLVINICGGNIIDVYLHCIFFIGVIYYFIYNEFYKDKIF